MRLWAPLLVCVVYATLACCGPVTVTEKTLGSGVKDIQWVDTSVVFLVTQDGELFRSSDGGKAWTAQNLKLHFHPDHTPSDAAPYVEEVHISAADPRYVAVLGRDRSNWVSDDAGNTYTPVAPLNIREIKLHPRQPKWILASMMSDGCNDEHYHTDHCYKMLFWSKDFGHTFTLAENYIVQFEWAPPNGVLTKRTVSSHAQVEALPRSDPPVEPTDDLIYATVHNTKTGHQKFGIWQSDIDLVCSSDYFHHSNKLIDRGNRFLLSERGYMMVAAVRKDHEAMVDLFISSDNLHGVDKHFRMALIPGAVTQHSYTILDTSEGSIFLNVNPRPLEEQSEVGHVYLSDWSGTRFSLSLPYNQRRPGDGTCVFYKVESLEGVYLANRINVEDDDDDTHEGWDEQETDKASLTRDKELKSQTLITFNKGGTWLYLMPPEKDLHGNPTNCSPEQMCFLHFLTTPDIVYSSSHAVGLILAAGTLGKYLQYRGDNVNTYLSRDGGISWIEVAQGFHIYAFGDHGGIIVMASTGQSTEFVSYSWDQGTTWERLQVSKTPIWIEKIVSDSTGAGLQFIIYGVTSEKGIVVFVDFAELHQKECQGQDAPGSRLSDFETWSPRDHMVAHAEDKDLQCLLGRQTKYLRRKREVACFNPEKVETVLSVSNCTCTRSDFECDYGYRLNTDKEGFPCEPDPNAEAEPPVPCTTAHYVTKGYRRVAGNTCVGGEEWDGHTISCTTAWFVNMGIGKFFFVLLLLGAIAFGLYALSKKFECIEDLFESIRSKLFGSKEPYHLLIGGKHHARSMEDDDDEEFGQSALVADRPFKSAPNSAAASTQYRGSAKKKGDVPLLNAAGDDDDD